MARKRISIAPKGEGKYTLQATKIESGLRFHPQRTRPPKPHPDWGHPVLRDIRKKRIFPTQEEAEAQLARLHEEYPEISIPGEHHLLIMVYGKTPDAASPVQKYRFTIFPVPEGGFTITSKLNIRTAPPCRTPAQKEPPQGYFSSMVQMKRRARKSRPDTAKGAKPHEE